MSELLVLVGTEKGAFTARFDESSARWRTSGPHLPGWEVSALTLAGNGKPRLLAGTTHYVYGATIRSSDDMGETWQEQPGSPAYDTDRGFKMNRIWTIERSASGSLFAGVDEAFPTLRHLSFHSSFAAAAREHPTMFKDTIKWEIAEAERITGVEVARAMARQARMYVDVAHFFEKYDYFVLPVTQVEPFDVTTEYPKTVAGTAMPTYIDWMRSCWYVSFMACPAISVPAGFTASGLPVGLQLVGPHRRDWSVLQMAYAFEQATRHGARRPSL